MSWYISKCGVAGEKFRKAIEDDFDKAIASMTIEEEMKSLESCKQVALSQIDFFAALTPRHLIGILSSGHACLTRLPEGGISGSGNCKIEVNDFGEFVE